MRGKVLDYRDGVKVMQVTVFMNLLLAAVKLAAGIIGRSAALVADAVHSLSDVLTTVIAIFGLKISNKKADADHPYGHEKFESIFVKLLSLILILTGAGIGYRSLMLIINQAPTVPTTTAIYGALFSIVVKEGMYWYTIITANKLNSLSMKADAWHHRIDAISSVIALGGIIGSRMGYVYLDAIAGLIVAAFIAKLGFDFYMQAVKNLTDESLSSAYIKQIRDVISSVQGVEQIVEIKTRIFGNKFYADIIIAVNPDLTVAEAHIISCEVHDLLESKFPDCKHCSVQTMPSMSVSSVK